MKLRELVRDAPVRESQGDQDLEITALAYDSRDARRGALFACVSGLRFDGHDFAADAVERGAAALLVERLLDLPVPEVVVDDVRAAMGPIAARLHGDPSNTLTVLGVTGTNGKTTTAFLTRAILEAEGTPTGLLGTVKRIVGGVEAPLERTTPESVDLQAAFSRMLEAGDRACVMEVSSHALRLGRARGTRFAAAAFTNLTPEHLDFHPDMDDYFEAKALLFDPPSGGDDPPAVAVVNADDPYGRRLINHIRDRGDSTHVITFSASGGAADLQALDVVCDAAGARYGCRWGGGRADVDLPLPGDFNVENSLAAIGLALGVGIEPDAAAVALSGVERVPGRFEPVNAGQPFAVIVDYAHTSDSLENALAAARRLTEGRLITVFGCGGDRDRQKRPEMGRIGARLSDIAIVTSDNPRNERPDEIIEQILAGARAAEGTSEAGVQVEPDRRAAIAAAIAAAGPKDTVVIAGKGHEQGQEFEDGRRIPFDDRRVAREEIRRATEGGPDE